MLQFIISLSEERIALFITYSCTQIALFPLSSTSDRFTLKWTLSIFHFLLLLRFLLFTLDMTFGKHSHTTQCHCSLRTITTHALALLLLQGTSAVETLGISSRRDQIIKDEDLLLLLLFVPSSSSL